MVLIKFICLFFGFLFRIFLVSFGIRKFGLFVIGLCDKLVFVWASFVVIRLRCWFFCRVGSISDLRLSRRFFWGVRICLVDVFSRRDRGVFFVGEFGFRYLGVDFLVFKVVGV